MIDIDTIQQEIEQMEARGQTTYAVCEKLAWLYIVRDHMQAGSGETVGTVGGSEFLDACAGVPYADLLRVIDEHMEAVKVVNRRAYDALVDKIRSIER